MFKKDDKVYSILRGWGEVTEVISEAVYPVQVSYGDGAIQYYTAKGYWDANHLIPELYHTEPTITVPKRRVEHRGWIGIWGEKNGKLRYTTHIYDTEGELEIELKYVTVPHKYTPQEITFYTEE